MFRRFAAIFFLGLVFTAVGQDAAASRARGEKLYRQFCFMCHQLEGKGNPGIFPPLAGSDYLTNKTAVIRALLLGLNQPITVSGRAYKGVMPATALNDQQLSDVLTY